VNVILWILQIVLAIIIFYHGWLLWTLPAMAQKTMAYMLAIPDGFRRFISLAEILAGFGLILPPVTGLLPWLTPLAAAGLVITLAGAVVFHIPRREYPNIGLNLLLLALAAFLAYGRLVVAPF
jgi:uncharacterized membrane protein YphA (DoxX/SURF4 family)